MNTDPVPIDPAKAIEAGYWFGVIDAIRDVYRMTFKDIKPSNNVDNILAQAVDKTLDMANIDRKHMMFVMEMLGNDIYALKQHLWTQVLMGLPSLKKEIVDKYMTEEFEGIMSKHYARMNKDPVPMSEEEAKRTGQ
jgi:hypothetical protein